jgi:hypothetical protein
MIDGCTVCTVFVTAQMGPAAGLLTAPSPFSACVICVLAATCTDKTEYLLPEITKTEQISDIHLAESVACRMSRRHKGFPKALSLVPVRPRS